ncbi:MAG: hypothetical protein OEX03_09730 [Gammaproteobacteria bacterium]|nr:hypothetical protein [Gammaproteobacteria bacterium]
MRGMLIVVGLLFAFNASANEVSILNASFKKDKGLWYVSVTLKHNDRGWDHYADAWRLVDANGKEIGKRVLFHPHEQEQPFTRSLGNVRINPTTKIIYVEAHDKVHGWSKQRLMVDLRKRQGQGFQVMN